MLKKILMPVTAAMLLLVSPVTLYAADNTSVGEVPAKFNLERDSILEKPKMDGIQLTSEDIKGHWLAAEVEDFNAADFDSNGDCHITIFQNGKNNDLCIHPDGSYESEEIEDEKIDQFQVLQSKNFIFYYGGLILFKTELFTEMICKLQKNKEEVATKIQVTVFKRVIYEDSLR